jgi:uncharacterized membrane protein (UPF0127 family)
MNISPRILQVKKLNGFWEKCTGLMGAKKPFTVTFKTRFGIHTAGLIFPIDVLILDSKNRVVKIAQDLKPGNVFFWNPLYDQVVELPEGEIAKRKIKIGEKLYFRKI